MLALRPWHAAALAALVSLSLPAGQAHAVGLLVPSDPALEALAIRHHRVTVSVRERSAETRVEQVFLNQTDRTLEGTYVFPVPPGATVSGFAMWVDGRRVEGELLDAARARGIYEAIVARMRDPGLVEHAGGSLFRARVFPIAPRSEQRIEIRFTQTLEYEGGVVHYRYPLRTSDRAARTLEDLTISVEVVSRTPIRAVYSPTHAIAVSREGDGRALASFETTSATLDRDFDLFYAVQDGDVGLSLLTHRPPGDDGYFLAMIAPRNAGLDTEIASKEILFVVDTSGSMAGDKIDHARAALDHMLARLSPSDHFQVIRFSTDVELLFDAGASMPATPEHVAAARRFARRMVPAGGTAISGALREALRTRRPAGAPPRMVVFLTDGMPTIGQTDPGAIVREVGTLAAGARVFVFGVGNDVNTTFLDSLAQGTGGVGEYFVDGREMQRRMTAFYDRVAYPVLADLHISIPGASTYDVYPRDLGHLYRGQQLLVVGRYRGQGPARVVLEGRLSHESTERSFSFDVNFSSTEARHGFLPGVWATRKVGNLLDEIRLHGERPELREEVVRVARAHGIVTPYTSYLVAEDVVLPPGLAPEPEIDVRLEVRASEDLGVDREESGAGGGEMPATESSADELDGFEATIAVPRTGSSARGHSGGSGGGAASSAEPSAPPPPAPAPAGASGERGRRVATRLREMRESERADAPSERGSRSVLGRLFHRRGSVWVDSRYHEGMRELRVRFGSSAFFALLRARRDLSEALSLGDRVVVTLDSARAIIVDPGAPETVDADAVERFVR